MEKEGIHGACAEPLTCRNGTIQRCGVPSSRCGIPLPSTMSAGDDGDRGTYASAIPSGYDPPSTLDRVLCCSSTARPLKKGLGGLWNVLAVG